MRNTYKKRRYLRKTMKKKQKGGNNDAFDAAKVHPASLNMSKKFIIKKSSIHGVGTFANKNIEQNEIIHVLIYMFPSSDKTPIYKTIDGKITFNIDDEFGKYVNHSVKNANTDVIKLADGNYYLMATHPIPKNTEILLNYDGKNIPYFIEGSKSHYKN